MTVILKNGRHFELLRNSRAFMEKSVQKRYVCQFCCVYENLKDYFTYLPR